jgi:hypothetical protein
LKEVPASEIRDKIEKREDIFYKNSAIKGDVNINLLGLPTYDGKYLIESNIEFRDSKFEGDVDFNHSIFKEKVDFTGIYFAKSITFTNSEFNGFACFRRSNINFASFDGCIFKKLAHFCNSRFTEYADFSRSHFIEETCFRGSQFSYLDLRRSIFEGDFLTFRNAKFASPESQEDACRRAKNVLEKNGDREQAGYHFYREMEGKRKQKKWYFRYPEFIFIQLIFGYGIHPQRLIFWWGAFVVTFSLLYWLGSGQNGGLQLFDYLKFSLATAIAPGYIATIISPGSTGYKLAAEYQAVAIIESIFGTFLWAGFIATFAKKYMR